MSANGLQIRSLSFNCCLRSFDFSLLCQYWGWLGSLYSPHNHALYKYVVNFINGIFFFQIGVSGLSIDLGFFFVFCFVPFVLLLPEAPDELSSSWDFHYFSWFCNWIDLCLYH